MRTFGPPVLAAILATVSSGATTTQAKPQLASDAFLWLEDVNGAKQLAWAEEQNKKTLKHLTADQRFEPLVKDSLSILNAKDKLVYGKIRNDYVYNHWQDEQHIKGLWRRQKTTDFVQNKGNWQTLIDLDQLAKEQGKNLVFKGAECRQPAYDLCLILLSDGGKDAVTVREFSLETGTFVKDGFYLPEAKTTVSWVDRDTLLVGSDFGPGSTTDSGYARTLRRWRRGTPIAKAPTVFAGQQQDTWVYSLQATAPHGDWLLYSRGLDFYHTQLVLAQKNAKNRNLDLPKRLTVRGIFHDYLIFSIQEDWLGFKKDSLLAAYLPALAQGKPSKGAVSAVFAADGKRFLEQVTINKDYLLVTFMENVSSRATYYTPQWDASNKQQIMSWSLEQGPDLGKGSLHTFGGDGDSNEVFFTHVDFLTPPTMYYQAQKDQKPTKIAALPERFNAAGLETKQYFATSKDGTKVPYYIVGPKGNLGAKPLPTLLYGYGGFEIPLLPNYRAMVGKHWLEKGGVYVLANIRGGGEFGSAWHQAALKRNRHKAYEDFFAIAEDLIARKVTTKDLLGIKGGSNGGLLMGVALTQRPDLFQAVICAVPLLDMLRFHKLLAGASWMAEYGNPDDASEGAYLQSYSPYQALKPKVAYPEPLIITSTRDDRVHPGHARKMTAKMLSLGYPVLYYENINGGHSASADNQERARMVAIEYSYLYQKLLDQSASH